ncbi:oligosaccharide flippase family protein [Actinomadura madurae]|uniref:oligosaccharide flippase family protein n=1 Tax=Actinomadura madurae TaxID=1993 RepID=UPI0020D2070F|nr:oligosaccharide flippase family protein [Actinomadura madurae]MCP9969379.1 oligosaccharide flippase family protein [Actinomadura madurae]MCQ0018067.1 oligosaccharide flippase family protein [Actinomadura madurae]
MRPDRARSPLGGHGWAAGPTLLSSLASATAAGTTLVIARGAGPREFGHFTLVLTIALIVAVGMLMSLHYVLLQELPRARPAERPALAATAFLSTLALGGGLAAAGALLSPLLAVPLGVDARTLCFSFALALSLALNQLTEGLLRGLARYRFVASLKLAVAAAYLAGSAFCLLVLGVRDAEVYLLALIATNAAFVLVALPGLGIVPRSWTRAAARSQYRLGAYMTVIAVLTGVLFGIDVIFLNRWAGTGDVGVYSVYNGFPKRLLGVLFTDGVGLVLLPALAVADKPPRCGASRGSPRWSRRARRPRRSRRAPSSSSCWAAATPTRSGSWRCRRRASARTRSSTCTPWPCRWTGCGARGSSPAASPRARPSPWRAWPRASPGGG